MARSIEVFKISVGSGIPLKSQGTLLSRRNAKTHFKMSGQFGFMSKIGATDAAVATLNDQPYIFTILVVILVALILQSVLIWYIHYATMKPEQKKKKEPKDKKPAAKPPAAR
ncbi:hypothetical protein F5Y02DRAFT_415934 [Annulohypoxylon stygium]|nr:hypothetical protein F5Y02DRAFT_415934 [Annulohypoxylon stygium]